MLVTVVKWELLDSLQSLLVLNPLRSTSAVGGAIFALHAKFPTSLARCASIALNLSLMAEIASQPKAFPSGSDLNFHVIHSPRIGGAVVGCSVRLPRRLGLSDESRRRGYPVDYKAYQALKVYGTRNAKL